MRQVLIPQAISSAPPPLGQVHDFSGASMGTGWSVRLVAPAAFERAPLAAGLQAQLDGVCAEMSHWQGDSCLSRFNRAAPGSWQVLPKDFFTVLSYALSVAHDSAGAYDPAAGALVNLWGFGPCHRYDQAGFQLPGAQAIRAACALPGWRQIELDPLRLRARQPGRVPLDLSAVAKGFGVDQLAHYLERQNIHHYLVEVGGELRGAGCKPDGQPWWVSLEQPPQAQQADTFLLALHGLSVATSGDYRRCYQADGAQYAHTLDPRTGYPLQNGIASVTVVHEECMAADALSTALSVLGAEAGLQFAEQRAIAARFLVRHPQGITEHLTSRMRALLQ